MKGLFTGILFVALSAPALADVTITTTLGGKGIGQMATGQTVTYIKGLKMRTETTMMGRLMTTILDLESGRSITLDAQRREASVADLSKNIGEAQKLLPAPPSVTFSAAGESRSILGQSCDRYDLIVAIPFSLPGTGNGGSDGHMTITLAGPVWVAKGGPGSADFVRFQTAAASQGVFPDTAEPGSAFGHATAIAAMNKLVADANGLAYSMELGLKLQGSGPLAELIGKMGETTLTLDVTKLATETLDDSLFSVPPGYKTR